MRILNAALAAVYTSAVLLLSGCHSVDDERIPAMPVSINLSDAGLWNTYGVSGFGLFRYFIPQLNEPAGYRYTANTATGFGGVLLIGGMDPFTTETNVPLAYDMACPVECDPNVRVAVDATSFEAICGKCGSHYDVTMQGGAPLSGPATEGKYKYGLTRYQCLRSVGGGYMITR